MSAVTAPLDDSGSTKNPEHATNILLSDEDGPIAARDGDGTLARPARILFGCYLMIFLPTFVYLLLTLWPEKQGVQTELLFNRWAVTFGPERRYLIIVVLTGAIGSFIHLATSFADFVGNRRLMGSWMWWYMLRPFIGTALALMLYFTVRGGLMSAESGAENLSAFGIAALAGLAGMFSKQVTDKLREVCDTAFNTASRTPARTDALQDSKAGVITAAH